MEKVNEFICECGHLKSSHINGGGCVVFYPFCLCTRYKKAKKEKQFTTHFW